MNTVSKMPVSKMPLPKTLIKTATTVAEAYEYLAQGIEFDVEPEVMDEISIAAEDPEVVDEQGDPING